MRTVRDHNSDVKSLLDDLCHDISLKAHDQGPEGSKVTLCLLWHHNLKRVFVGTLMGGHAPVLNTNLHSDLVTGPPADSSRQQTCGFRKHLFTFISADLLLCIVLLGVHERAQTSFAAGLI